MGYLTTGLQTILFLALLPAYTDVWVRVWNWRRGLHHPIQFPYSLLHSAMKWMALDFGVIRHQALFSIAASATTVFVVSVAVSWWWAR